MEPDAGGEAPSVDAKTKIETTAANGATPTLVKAVKEIKPIEVSVAVEESGPATKTIIAPTKSTIIGLVK